MKLVFMVYASFILFVVTSLFAGGQPAKQAADSNLQVISMDGFSNSMWESFFKGEMPEVAVKCPRGMSLPFHFMLGGEFLAVEPKDVAPYTLRILKTCFVRCKGEDDVLFSSDLQSWKDFQAFFTGMIGVAMHEDTSQVSLNIELNQRLEEEEAAQ